VSKAIELATAPGAVRIIGGNLRNSKLSVPSLAGLRPTPDRVRETLFNWLAPMIAGARVMDMFAGTGALGIEALSRGAAFVEFVEADQGLAKALQSALTRLHVAARARVRCRRAPGQTLNDLAPFDLIFLDPPFSMQLWHPALDAITAANALTANGLVYLETPDSAPLPPGWQVRKFAKAGAVTFGLYAYVH
jgi:16S rRNA (guanine966-N2)-methyltransferase